MTGAVLLAGGLLWRLAAGPIRLAFLDRPIAAAIAGIAPGLGVEVGATTLVRFGRAVALEVADVRLTARDGTPILSVPRLHVRPSLGALVRGRLVIARLDVEDTSVPLTRTVDGAWTLGTGAAGVGLALAGLGTSGSETQSPLRLPRIAFTRCRVSIDDRRSGGSVVVSDADVVVSPSADGLVASVAALLDVESAVPPVRGRVHLPIRAELVVVGAPEGGVREARIRVTGAGGSLTPATEPDGPLALVRMEATGTYRPDDETLELTRLAAVVGASQIDARARVLLRAAPTLALDGTVDVLALATLTALWPPELAPAVRRWLAANLRAGSLRHCRIRLGAPFVAGADGSGDTPLPERRPGADAAPGALDVACDFAGVEADYLAPLDAIRAATGSARLTAERLTVDVRSGEVGACHVDGGTLAMDLTVDPPQATIAADVSGATADVLALVEKPPIAFTPPLGIVRTNVGGTSRVHADLRLPIASTVAPADVRLQATAALSDASLPALAAGVGIRDGRLDVRVDGATIDVRGTTGVTGVPMLPGPVTVALTVAPGSSRAARRATLALDADGLLARGSAELQGESLTTLVVDRLRLDGSDVAATVRRSAAGDYDVAVSGARLDLEKLLAGKPLGSEPGSAWTGGLSLSLALGRVRTARDLDLRDVRGSVRGRDGRLDAFDVHATLVPGGAVHAVLSAGAESRQLAVTSDEAGRLLRAVAGLKQFAGGSLVLDATTDARGPLAFLEGTLLVRNFKVVQAPVLAKILGIGSLGGIAALVQGEGMPMSEARFPFRWDGGRLELHDVRAVGAVGLTADGVIDQRAGRCDVHGAVIPAYALSSALGNVPLLGRLLGGAKGDGVFGIDYAVSGSTADPTVRVNPLSSIAPTVLRTWFVDPFSRGASGGGTRRPRR